MDDWDTVTKIGSKTGGGASQRQTVVRGKGALNQAQRSGAIVGTEKKYATGNTINKGGSDGQRHKKVDETNDVMAVQKVPKTFASGVEQRRSKEGPYKMTQAELAKKVNVPVGEINKLEKGEGKKDQGLQNKVARVLKIHPTSGEPLPEKK